MTAFRRSNLTFFSAFSKIYFSYVLCDVLRYLVPFVQLKNMKNTHWGVLLSVKLQSETYKFTEINTPLWVFFTFFKLYKWYQEIAQSIIYFLSSEKQLTLTEILFSCETRFTQSKQTILCIVFNRNVKFLSNSKKVCCICCNMQITKFNVTDFE